MSRACGRIIHQNEKAVMTTPKTEAQQRAQKEYMKKIARVEITMPLEKRQQLQDHARNRKESVNAFVNRAIVETMERDN